MNTLNINYGSLIILFTAGVPINALNMWTLYERNTFFGYVLGTQFLGLIIIDVALVCLFYDLWREKRPRSFRQNFLTLGNVIAVFASATFLINNLATHGL